MTVDCKLGNILLYPDDHAARHPELYFRAASGAVSVDGPSAGLTARGRVDFLTYLNALSACKWRAYAGIETAWLHAEVSGSGSIEVLGVEQGSDVPKVVDVVEVDTAAGAVRRLEIEVVCAPFDLVGFALVPKSGATMGLVRAWWHATVERDRVNTPRLALVTTTFCKESYVTENIERVRRAMREEGDPVEANFHMFVVDNGRTLDAAALSDDMVTVLPNRNVGGAGGFARGMLAATEEPGAFTHVLVMDDDVRIIPESLIRTYALLMLARGAYRTAFVNGAMLALEDPTRLYEDVSYVLRSGMYRRVKEDLDVGGLAGIVCCERTSVEVPRAYGAWWYSCIPVEVIRDRGLPMPFFIRCDDVEFGVRNDPTFMTMIGIGVWHEGFEGRFRASVDCYQYVRNFLATMAMDGCASDVMFIARLRRTIRQDLRDLDYRSAELLLDGVEDYLKGPDYLRDLDGAALLAQLGARNERMEAVTDLDPTLLRDAGVTQEVLGCTGLLPRPSHPLMRLWRTVPYDKHYLPPSLLKKKPGYVVKHGHTVLEGDSTGCATLVVLDPTRTRGVIRHMDRARFRAIRTRERMLLRRYRVERGRVRRGWKEARPYLTSREFWIRYLGL